MSSVEEKPEAEVLTTSDLEAALRLLEQEERSAESIANTTRRRDVLALVINDTLIGAMLFALLTGLIILGFRWKLGLLLLAIAVVSFALLCLTVRAFGDFRVKVDQVRGAFADTNLAQVAGQAWTKRSLGPGCAILACVVMLAVGYGTLLYGLLARDEVFPYSLILSGLAFLIFLISISISSFREFKYFSKITRLRERFEQRLQQHHQGTSSVLSVKEKQLLSQVEQQQVQRSVEKVLEEYSEQPTLFSIALASTAIEHLARLSEEERIQVREALDTLQTNPRPEHAVPTTVAGEIALDDNRYTLTNGRQIITYTVDDSRERVDVIQISENQSEGIIHAP